MHFQNPIPVSACTLLDPGQQVTGGSALGITSRGTDSLMSSTVQPGLAGAGFAGSAQPPGQQNGYGGVMGGLGSEPPKNPQGGQQKSAAVAVAASPLRTLLASMVVLVATLLPAML